MASLWKAVDEARTTRVQSWDDVRQATLCMDVERVRLETYGIRMHDAMNLVRWLEMPSASFMYPAELNPARPGSAAYPGPDKAGAEATAPSELERCINATCGKTDDQIIDFAEAHGGFPSICRTIIMWLRAVINAGDFEIAMDLGEGAEWTFRSAKGKSSFQYQLKKSAKSTLVAPPADFMRLVFSDLDVEAARRAGRIAITGDTEPVVRLFRSLGASA